jgi:hypothetical protein
MMASTMRNIHVPAYAPVLLGVHREEKSGVLWSVVKTMDMLLLLEPIECDIPLMAMFVPS